MFKPTDAESWDVPKVGDWGLSWHLLDTDPTEGLTLPYAAPEQLENSTTDARTDIYQLGAICYEAFTGQPPYSGSSLSVLAAIKAGNITPPSAVNPSLPPELDRIMLAAMATDPAKRYEAVRYLRDDLAALSSTDQNRR